MSRAPVGFDLDQTLIDARPAIMAAWEAVAAETGVEIDLADVDRRLGIKLEDELAWWFPPEEQAPAAAAYRRHYVVLAAAGTTALPGAGEALDAVRRTGAGVVIVTAKHPVSVEPCLAATGLSADRLFTHVHGREKAAVLRRIGASAYVGDTPADMAAAHEAGAFGVGVTTGSFGRQVLVDAGAGAVLTSLLEFPDWLRGGPCRERPSA